MEDELFIPILLGTARIGRHSEKVAKLVEQIGKEISGIEVTIVDPRTLKLPPDGNNEDGEDSVYADITKRADGFIIVTPEYNASFPGSLKRMLDSELENYFHKPVVYMGVSNGPWGGVRVIEALVATTRKMGMVPVKADVQFPDVEELFDKNGNILEEAYKRRIKRSFDELIWFAKALKAAKNE